jgi:hypothetical protein
MATSRTAERSFLVVRPVGAQTTFDVAAIAGELGRQASGAEGMRVLFDWSQLKSWPFAAPSIADGHEWSRAALPIARAALVHDRKWDRHAAVLSALLRISGAQARSFRLCDRDNAIDWLKQAALDEVEVR